MLPICIIIHDLFSLFVYLSREENKAIVYLESVGIKCALHAESKNMKLDMFLKGAVGLEVRNLRKSNVAPNKYL